MDTLKNDKPRRSVKRLLSSRGCDSLPEDPVPDFIKDACSSLSEYLKTPQKKIPTSLLFGSLDVHGIIGRNELTELIYWN